MVIAARVHEMGVRDIANAVAKGEMSPTDVAEAVINRINTLEPKVQAFSYLDIPRIREEARVLTEEATAGRLRGPLHGVPVGIKDEFHVQGMPTDFRDLPTRMPEPTDATPVARLRAAGAIIVGKTHMPVGGRIPPTRNPWNLEHTAGGSSSGSGAAVGARIVPVAMAEQTVGSGMRPTAYCGVEAIKPTYGRISRYGCYPFAWSMDHPDIIGLTMEDIALVLSVVAGPDPKDPTALPDPAPSANLNLASVRPPRIGVIRNFYPDRSQPVMNQAVEKAAGRLRDAGAQVSDALFPEMFGAVWPAYQIVFGLEGAAFNYDRPPQATRPGAPPAIGDRRPASLIPGTYYLHAQRIRYLLSTKVSSMFRDFDALLMTATPAPAPKGFATTGDASLLGPWSFLGNPTVTVNAGLSPDGLPIGLQLAGAPKDDYHLLQVGGWCSNALGRLPAPPLAKS